MNFALVSFRLISAESSRFFFTFSEFSIQSPYSPMPRSGRLCKTRERAPFILQPNIRTFILQKLDNFEPGALLINSLSVMQTGSLSFIQHIDVTTQKSTLFRFNLPDDHFYHLEMALGTGDVQRGTLLFYRSLCGTRVTFIQ